MSSFEDIQTFTRDTFETQVKSFGELQKGAQSVIVEIADYAKKALEANAAVFQKLSAANSLDAALEIQGEFAKASYESLVQHLTKVGTIATDAVNGACTPVETVRVRAS